MPLKPQSIRKGVTIFLNGKEVEKQEIMNLSINWTEPQVELFKKFLKQGGSTTINGSMVKIIPKSQNLNSRGEKDPGKIVYQSIDMRF